MNRSLLILLLCAITGCKQPSPPNATIPALPDPSLRVTTPFADLEIVDEGNHRTLYTHQPDGTRGVASRIHRDKPHQLIVPYMQHMIGANLIQPQAEQALLIGVGGGSMIHFLQHYFSDLTLDAVDIDPIANQLAVEWFGIQPDPSMHLITADGFDFIRNNPSNHYDIVYLDAFLRPSETTDHAGVPLTLKTLEFYHDLKRILRRDGVIAYNLHDPKKTEADRVIIQQAFAHTRALIVPDSQNVIVLASDTAFPKQLPLSDLPDLSWINPLAAQLVQP